MESERKQQRITMQTLKIFVERYLNLNDLGASFVVDFGGIFNIYFSVIKKLWLSCLNLLN